MLERTEREKMEPRKEWQKKNRKRRVDVKSWKQKIKKKYFCTLKKIVSVFFFDTLIS